MCCMGLDVPLRASGVGNLMARAFEVTGYSLPFDQVGYWAIRIVTGVPDSFPILGPVIVGVLRGGPSVGQGTLNRFFAAHVLVLPLLTATLNPIALGFQMVGFIGGIVHGEASIFLVVGPVTYYPGDVFYCIIRKQGISGPL